MDRAPELSIFLDAVDGAIRRNAAALTPSARAGAAHVFTTLARPEPGDPAPPQTQPATGWLDPALATAEAAGGDVAAVAAAFRGIAPAIHWRVRPPADDHPAGFATGHGSAHIVGPYGLEVREDVIVGASLLAPEVTYPDHRHPPREIYLVLSEGDWRQAGQDWRRPGPGGLVCHEPNVIHAMRSGAAPLFAIWMLWNA